ncbi:flagellar motor switch protein FliG [Natronocella acetinitrilica]|uniref:Flagellar motor switch protein FliG n=2 Tax=Natronocella acetinitrilica TaxID=414046 RepID=A0AAE3KCB6_9GAMM|nr:flagellar motor switch protein FliG [Natronocella acetinitrilica]
MTMTENSPSPKLSGAEKAAVFLMSLGEDTAASVMKHLGPKEVQLLGSTMTSLKNIRKEQVEAVVDDFVTTVGEQTALGIGNSDYIRSVLVKALGEDKAGNIIDRIMMGGNTRGLEQLKWLDGKTVAEMLRLEHPQIIAIVMSYLDPDHAAEVLANLPERIRHDILMRVATLQGVQPAALQELDEIMERQFTGKQRLKSSSIGGIQAAANILNYLDSAVENPLMEQVTEMDADLSQKIQDLMFTFNDLVELDDRGIQALLREVSSELLVLALKGADDALKDKMFKNLSRRASEMLQDDLDARGPVRVSDVEQAQKEVLTVAKRMADEGQISLGGGGDEYI